MRILLVNMPWAAVEAPSLVLGNLAGSAHRQHPDVDIDIINANIDYIDWAVAHTGFGMRDYDYFGVVAYFSGFGDWIFTSAMHDDPEWRLPEFLALAEHRGMTTRERDLAVELHRLTPQFVAELAQRIVDQAPDVVGFTAGFQQNIACLAMARQIKRLDPRIRTVLTGADCDGDMGAAIHRNFPFVDFLLRGEVELAFPQLLSAIGGAATDTGATDLAAIEGLCWTGPDGSVANQLRRAPLPPSALVCPDYTGYAERLATSIARTWTEPRLVVEGSRGCWWGAKHQCTFCGLNGSDIQFRSKDPDQFYDEIIGLVERHQILDVLIVDNILDMGYLTTLLPRLAKSGYDLRLHQEIKANMTGPQLQLLAEAGVVHVEPGVESLNARVLTLMNKGVTGCQNVRLLRDAETHGLTVSWNYLYGFPGEDAADYQTVIDQMPALTHLHPPVAANRIAMERFSPYFNRPELGFTAMRPIPPYQLNYDLPEAELMDLAHIFAVDPQGIGEETTTGLDRAIARWNAGYPCSRLAYHRNGSEIVLINERPAFDWRVLRLTSPVEVAAFDCLDQPQTVAKLARRLGRPAGEIEQLLDRWRELGIVFQDGDQSIHVVTHAANQNLIKIDQRTQAERDEEYVPARSYRNG